MTTATAKKAPKKAIAKKVAKGMPVDQQSALVTEWHDLKAVETVAKKPYDDAVEARQAVEESINKNLAPGLTFDVPGVGLRETSENEGKSVGYKTVLDTLKVIYEDETAITGEQLAAKIEELILANTTKNPRITFKNSKQ